MLHFGSTEVILIVIVLLVLFGKNQLTEIARSAGETSKEIKKIKKEYEGALDETKQDLSPEPTHSASKKKKRR